MNIDFIYFDVGGVVMLDFSKTNKWLELLHDLGVNDRDLPKLNALFDKEELAFCTGKQDSETFVEVLRNEFKLAIPQNYSFVSDKINRSDPNPSLVEIINNLKQKYRVGLLTNMYQNMLSKIMQKGLVPSNIWDVIIDSSVVGVMKPYKEIYEIAESAAKTEGNKILFVDNIKINIDIAKEMGWNTYLYDPSSVSNSNENLLKLLKTLV